MKLASVLTTFIVLFLGAASLAPAAEKSALDVLDETIPKTAAECTLENLKTVRGQSIAIESWAAQLTWQKAPSGAQTIARLGTIIKAKQRVDADLQKLLGIRGEVAPYAAEAGDRQFARNFLAIASQLIDLSGRLRFILRDAITSGGANLSEPEIDQAINLMRTSKVSVGASALAPLLDSPELSYSVLKHIVDLMGVSNEPVLISDLAKVIRNQEHPPDLRMSAIIAVINLGVPQDAQPNAPKGEAAPVITAKEMATVLAALRFTADFDPSYLKTREQILPRLQEMAAKGYEGSGLRYGTTEIRPGDWLLIRNPSPYNQVTDLAPGLFTHVGVVAETVDSDKRRRLVLVEIPERGDKVPGTNVDVYLARTLHYMFLRHPDEAVQAKMAEVAATVIGNETQFDLTFQSRRVRELKGQPLAGARLHTYCAGLLHLCAQETDKPLEDFFPIIEGPPGGYCLMNLEKLGMAIGDDFVSPTGALLSSKLVITGQREPMYDPGREVKEAVYDYFAKCLVDKQLEPSPDAYQSLRTKVAGLAKTNPWLAKALAKTNNVSEHIDLEAAAKAAAVIETLDEIADDALRRYLFARKVVTTADLNRLPAAERASAQSYRRAHSDLANQFGRGTASPRDVRIALVAYYSQYGHKQVDARFFPLGANATTPRQP